MKKILDRLKIGEERIKSIPALVVKRALSAGEKGEEWLAGLNNLIGALEKQWSITVGKVLSGGTHAFVAYADGRNGEKYVLKIDMPENLGGEFLNSMAALEMADGRGCAKLYAYDPQKAACLLERLGKPVNQLDYPVSEQLRIICSALQKVWEIPVTDTGFPSGKESIAWFRAFIGETWGKLGHPCSHKVIERAFSYLQSREEAMNPAEFVFLHGDAHASNTLEELTGGGYKLIDPDGLIYEKAYDLGVLMREWVEEYGQAPLKKGKERCSYLHYLTGVPQKAIWEWGFLQTVSTAFVILQVGEAETGKKMLDVAESWASEYADSEWEMPRDRDYLNGLAQHLASEYGFAIRHIVPAKRGFFGETWNVQTDAAGYFVKIDYWNFHQESYKNSLPVINYMVGKGISFVPQVIKTKSGKLYCPFHKGITAVFEYVQGDNREDYPIEQLFGHLAEIYKLSPIGTVSEKETFGTGVIDTFQKLRNELEMPVEVKKALNARELAISKYIKRLKQFSDVCSASLENFYITHGDAGGNCILNEGQFFITDWDSVKYAPIERDAWFFMCDSQQIDIINAVLSQHNIHYRLKWERLCYYCYYSFFYYLTEYMESILSTGNQGQKQLIVKNIAGYLADCWIYKQLDAADTINIPPENHLL